ncbi:MAG: hypothetical protein IKN00_00925, partial [Bacteroidales bacterium]|nr:hypothetical protein [Bacteroidales bacterium]
MYRPEKSLPKKVTFYELQSVSRIAARPRKNAARVLLRNAGERPVKTVWIQREENNLVGIRVQAREN